MPMMKKKNKSKLPPELLIVVEDADQSLGENLSSSIPTPDKPFNAKVISSLAQALTGLTKLMGGAAEFEAYSAPVETVPPDLARFLVMASKAAEDYGQPFPVALEDIQGDRDITAITAHIITLAGDRDFKDWLQEEEEEESVEEEVMDEEEKDSKGASKKEYDFASRVGRMGSF